MALAEVLTLEGQTSPPVQELPEQKVSHPLIPLLNRATHRISFDPTGNITITEGGFGLRGLRIFNPQLQEDVRVWTDGDFYRIVHENRIYVLKRNGNFDHTEFLDPECRIFSEEEYRRTIRSILGDEEIEIHYNNGTRGYWNSETGVFVGAAFNPAHITDGSLIKDVGIIDGFGGKEYRIEHANGIVTYWNMETESLLSTLTYDPQSLDLPEGFTHPIWTE